MSVKNQPKNKPRDRSLVKSNNGDNQQQKRFITPKGRRLALPARLNILKAGLKGNRKFSRSRKRSVGKRDYSLTKPKNSELDDSKECQTTRRATLNSSAWQLRKDSLNKSLSGNTQASKDFKPQVALNKPQIITDSPIFSKTSGKL